MRTNELNLNGFEKNGCVLVALLAVLVLSMDIVEYLIG